MPRDDWMSVFPEFSVKCLILALKHLKSLAVFVFHSVVPRNRDIWPDVDCANETSWEVNKGRKLSCLENRCLALFRNAGCNLVFFPQLAGQRVLGFGFPMNQV